MKSRPTVSIRRYPLARRPFRCALAGVVLAGVLVGCQETKPSLLPADYPDIDLHEGVREILPGMGIMSELGEPIRMEAFSITLDQAR